MAMVNNYTLHQTSVTKNPASRLSMMQARFQQRQQEEKEHKLFAMLEEQNDVTLPLIHNNSNRVGSNGVSQQNSASSVNSFTSSSNGSSLASSLGSTGSGYGNAGKVRQMFEDRRGVPNAPARNRPAVPAYSKTLTRKPSPSKGYDRSYPLDPLPSKVPNYRKRGVSLERPAVYMNPEDLRRSRSQYQVYEADGNPDRVNEHVLQKPMNPYNRQNKSTTSLSENNNRFGYGSNNNFSDYDSGDTEDGGRYKLNQTYRRAPPGLYEAINGAARLSEMVKENKQMAERARQLEAENQRIQAEARKREQQLLETIRQQQAEMQRLQQLAAQAEQKAKAAAAMNSVSAYTTLRPSTKKSVVSFSTTDESDDAKSEGTGSSVSDKTYISPKINRTKPQNRSNGIQGAAEHSASPKGALAKSKPATPSNKPQKSPRQSIFASALNKHKDGLVECKVCGRSFAAERVEKHQSICEKTAAKKRKVFDITKMRVEGTEAESFVLENPVNPGRTHQPAEPVHKKPPVPIKQTTDESQAEKPAWRRKHESFLETIRAAKAAQRHLDNGGSLADLPPPPPSDTSDYIECPHCGRRFSPAAADRHIPKCANIKSNKPKQK